MTGTGSLARASGDEDVRDLVTVAAMFAWANRLMTTLGVPVRDHGAATGGQ